MDRVFVGFSSNTMDGSDGLLAMAQACRQDFGAQALVATSRELFDTPNAPTPSGSAWIQPVPTGPSHIDAITQVIGDANRGLSCGGWSDDSLDKGGLYVIGASLGFSSAKCDEFKAVACSLPNSAPSAYEFTGFSTGQVDGVSGFAALDGACRSTFGTSARIATSVEIFRSTNTAVSTGAAWVQPVLGAAEKTSDVIAYQAHDKGLACHGWTELRDSPRGLQIDATDRRFDLAQCTTLARVACALPQ